LHGANRHRLGQGSLTAPFPTTGRRFPLVSVIECDFGAMPCARSSPLAHARGALVLAWCVAPIVLASVDSSFHARISSSTLNKVLSSKSSLLLRQRLYGGCAGTPGKQDSLNHTDVKRTCKFRVKVQETKPGDVVKIVGESMHLGNWKLDGAISLKTSPTDYPWYIKLSFLNLAGVNARAFAGGMLKRICRLGLLYNTSS
jgi:hypothetical protein